MSSHPPPTPITSLIHQITHKSIHPCTNLSALPFILLHSSAYSHTCLPFHSPPHMRINSFTHHSPVHPQSISDPPTHPPYICLPTYTPPHPSTCPSIDLSIHLHINPYTHPTFTYPSVLISVHPPISPPLHTHSFIHFICIFRTLQFCSVISCSQPQNLPLNK